MTSAPTMSRQRCGVATIKVRGAASDLMAPSTWVQGDRNQYFKLTTLLTHLGLILFLVGGAVTVSLGFETVVFVGEGPDGAGPAGGHPRQPAGQGQQLPGAASCANGTPADFVTDLSVFQDGQEIARKDIRVNDPLEVQGFVFHQNTFGPSVDLTIHDPTGRLVWTGPMLLDDAIAGFPSGFTTIPGSDVGAARGAHEDRRRRRGALLLQGVGADGRCRPA